MSGNRWDVMAVREYTRADGSQGTNWTRVGSGFTNKNGSINVQLDAFPVDGKIQLQVPISKEERQARFEQRQGGGGQQRGWPQRAPQSQPQQRQQGNAGRWNQGPQQPPAPPPYEPEQQQDRGYPPNWDEGQDRGHGGGDGFPSGT